MGSLAGELTQGGGQEQGKYGCYQEENA